MAKTITIMGSTGSIGLSTLDLIDRDRDAYSVYALVAGQNSALLAEQARHFRPKIVGISDLTKRHDLEQALVGTGIEIVAGQQECDAIAGDKVDIVVAGVVGLAGLGSVMAAANAGNVIALANKESLVSAGQLVCDTAIKNGARLLPLDSEHSAVFQCWQGWRGHQSDITKGQNADQIGHICLTASGGPFRDRPLDSFNTISVGEAVKHPNWSMGRKISVDSATMMNKGLEVIEAAWLFELPSHQIDVVVHPQVAIHGLVYFNDGSVISQLASADMKTPISYALAWPQRMDWRPEPMDLRAIGRFDFFEVDPKRYPCFYLAREALEEGGAKPAILNAANEIAVEAFLTDAIDFTSISAVVETVLASDLQGDMSSLNGILDLDLRARRAALEKIGG